MMTFLWIAAVLIEAIGYANRGDEGAQVFLTCVGIFFGIILLMAMFA